MIWKVGGFPNKHVREVAFIKGQLILKHIFDVFSFFKKTNENKLTWGIIVLKSNSFVRFLEEIEDTKNPFEIIWPLVSQRFSNYFKGLSWRGVKKKPRAAHT